MTQPGDHAPHGDGHTPDTPPTDESDVPAGPTGPATPPEPEAAADEPRSPEQAAAETADLTEELTEEVGTKPPPRKAAVIYNPIKTDLDVLRAAVEAAAESAGYEETLWLETAADDPGMSMAREAVEAGCSVVLAAGGDGTVRAVAEGLRGSSTAMGLVPAGTGNLLARNLALPINDLETSVSIAFAGEDKAIDLGIASVLDRNGDTAELPFLVMAGVGLDAQMIVNTDEDLKKKAGWLAYVQAIGRSLKGGRRIKLRYTLDDHEPRVTRLHTLLVGNCGDLPGDVVLLPEAELDDGVLDIVALRPDGPIGWLSITLRVLVEHKLLRRSEIGRKMISRGEDGNPKPIRALRYLRGSRIRVQISEPEEFELDGDAVGEVTEFTAWLETGGLTVRVPA